MTQRPHIVLASGNPGKLQELRDILGDGGDVSSAKDHGVELPEETGTTFEDNAILKARAVAEATGHVAIADDSGLSVDALDGAPGVYSARFSGPEGDDERNIDLLLERMQDVPDEDRGAYFASCIAIAFSPDDIVCSHGTCDGAIGHERRGTNGFGYDPVFVFPDGRTMAELPSNEKNRISHRAHAMEGAVEVLRERLDIPPEGGPL